MHAPLPRQEAAHALSLLNDRLDADELERLSHEGAQLRLADAVTFAQRGRGTRSRPATGWRSLTPTELAVVELVAEGCKNAEIAQRMFISIATVKTHLAHVFTKLEVSTRTELASRAARRA
jgi:DNA-binding CsgD family transcriptional regulator